MRCRLRVIGAVVASEPAPRADHSEEWEVSNGAHTPELALLGSGSLRACWPLPASRSVRCRLPARSGMPSWSRPTPWASSRWRGVARAVPAAVHAVAVARRARRRTHARRGLRRVRDARAADLVHIGGDLAWPAMIAVAIAGRQLRRRGAPTRSCCPARASRSCSGCCRRSARRDHRGRRSCWRSPRCRSRSCAAR